MLGKEGFTEELEKEDWSYLGSLALSLESKLSKEDKESKKLEKELQAIKRLLHIYLSDESQKEKLVSASFLVKLYRTIEKLEKKLKEYEYERSEFLSFLHIIFNKLKKEKIMVKKVMEKKLEFLKHKKEEDELK